jgi:hypothetical protein
MNFNLVSGNENGSDFLTRFRDDIVIPKDSKVYLNFAQLSRDIGVFLEEDETMTLISNDVMPTRNALTPATSTSINEVMTVPKGFYKYEQFVEKIDELLATTLGNLSQTYYYSSFSQPITTTSRSTDFQVGLFLDDGNGRWINKDLALDGANGVGFGIDAISGDYVKTSANAFPNHTDYDNYGISDTHYYHSFLGCSGQQTNNNLIYFTLNKSSSQLQGRVCLSLYSLEYAGISGATNIIGNTMRTNNSFLKSGTQYKSPRCFLNIEVSGDNAIAGDGGAKIRIEVARTTGNVRIRNWTSINNAITTFDVIDVSLSNFFTNTEDISLGLQTYFNNTNDEHLTTGRKLYFRLYKITGEQRLDDEELIYDSYNDNLYFNNNFFSVVQNAGGANANEINASIPFKVLLSATDNGEGFKSVNYREFDKSNDDATNQRCIVNSYQLEFSKLLEEFLNVQITQLINPNICETMNSGFYIFGDLTLNFKNENYSIIIDELPLNNYKNTDRDGSGGYKQNILANIPAPFSNILQHTEKKLITISANYAPQFKIISHMNNQEIKTNRMRVRILNMNNDKPATEIKRAIINFTVYKD